MNTNDTYTQAASKLLELGYRVKILAKLSDLDKEYFGLEVTTNTIDPLKEMLDLQIKMGDDWKVYYQPNGGYINVTLK